MRNESELDKLKRKVEEATRKKVALKEKQPIIKKVESKKKSYLFTTVERDQAVENLFERKNIEEKAKGNSYNPKFTAVEPGVNGIT